MNWRMKAQVARSSGRGMAGLADASEGPMRQEKHMMDNHAKRNLRGLVASAIFAAVLGLGSGPASALVVTFDPESEVAGPLPANSFERDGFTFTFTGAGDGPPIGSAFTYSSGVSDTGGGIFATSAADSSADPEIITIARSNNDPFFPDGLWVDTVGSSPVDIVVFFDGGGSQLVPVDAGAMGMNYPLPGVVVYFGRVTEQRFFIHGL